MNPVAPKNVPDQNLNSTLNISAAPFTPGSIDAILNACGGQVCSRPMDPKPPEKGDCSQLKSAKVPNVIPETTNAWSAPLPRVWSRSTPALFPTIIEPVDSYKKDGVITVDEDEAANISARFVNTLVGRVVGKNFNFDWLESQLHAKWGSTKDSGW